MNIANLARFALRGVDRKRRSSQCRIDVLPLKSLLIKCHNVLERNTKMNSVLSCSARFLHNVTAVMSTTNNVSNAYKLVIQGRFLLCKPACPNAC